MIACLSGEEVLFADTSQIHVAMFSSNVYRSPLAGFHGGPMTHDKGFLLFCKGDLPHRRNPQRKRHVTREMVPLAPCPSFQ